MRVSFRLLTLLLVLGMVSAPVIASAATAPRCCTGKPCPSSRTPKPCCTLSPAPETGNTVTERVHVERPGFASPVAEPIVVSSLGPSRAALHLASLAAHTGSPPSLSPLRL